ncbi:MAG: translation initiation factor IF-2 [Xenococcaceae cyanobacterium MO_207.B15]|nr:translation initiation factor IF-2 [Xenococcaceae cyanobacterium MO_207.B15]
MNNGKVRIYELSKELNLENKDIKDICEQLNIAVKSHSSTITDSQADRVRGIAAKYTPEKTIDRPTTQNPNRKSKGKIKRKQQILAIHHKTDNLESASPTQAKSSSASTLAAPPKRPVRPQAPVSSNPATKSPVPPTAKLQAPPKPPQTIPKKDKAEKTPSESLEPKVARDETAQTNSTVVADKPTTPKPQLIAPPSRSQPVKGKEKSSSVTELPQVTPPKVTIGAKPKTAKVEPPSPNKPEKDKPAPTLPKLQRPQRLKPTEEPTEPDITPTQEPDVDLVDDSELELEKTGKKAKKDKLKRPNPPHKTKAKVWEDEEEEDKQGKSGKAKAGAKAKRRPKPLIDEEDEEELFAEQNNNQADTAISISIARPPKPKELEKQANPVAAKKPRKSAPKAEKTTKSEKRNRKVVTGPPEQITLTSNLTVRELAELLNTPETDIIKSLFFKGIAVNITQTLDLDIARTVAEELGVAVEIPEAKSAATKETEMLDAEDLENLQLRPPVVTIMGHVDHGKTTLLDSIRKSKVAQGEAGGITQHIGAYHVDLEHNGKEQQIVFLDTPGHEAFTAMRARGTRVTDIAVLVVAADDGVQPQTREAISHARAAEVPLVVAINKVDKPESNPERIKQELTEHGLVAEDWGGDTIMVPVSALKGDNLDNLLEMILLVAEIEELSANPDRFAKGTVIEAHLDRARGPVATLLVQNGTLRVGDSIVAGSVLGKIRAMIDDRGDKVEAATPSFAVEVLGLNDVPEAGDEFDVYPTEKEARALADKRADAQRDSRLQQAMSSRRVSLSTLSAQAQEGELKELNLILKADVQGSVEAILGSLQQLPQNEVQIRVLLAAPGEVTETDVDLAAASGAVIIGFNTTLASGSRQAAENEGVDIRQYNIIYKLLDDIQGAMEGLLDPEEVEESLGEVEVRAIFPVGRGSVAGCYVLSGKVVRNCQMRVRRGKQVVYEGSLDSLKRMKEDAKEVNAGYECGIGAAKFNDWKEGDIIEAYEMVFKRRTLSAK